MTTATNNTTQVQRIDTARDSLKTELNELKIGLKINALWARRAFACTAVSLLLLFLSIAIFTMTLPLLLIIFSLLACSIVFYFAAHGFSAAARRYNDECNEINAKIVAHEQSTLSPNANDEPSAPLYPGEGDPCDAEYAPGYST